MSKKRKAPAKLNVSALYAYHIPDPYKQQRWWHDKHGVLVSMSMEQCLEEVSKPRNRFDQTLFEAIAPPLCFASAILILFLIVANA